MPMKAFFAILALAASLTAQVKTDDMNVLGLAYELRVLDDTQTIEMTLRIDGLDRPHLRVGMPEWTPGSYSIQGYGSWVSELHARSGERELEIARIDRGLWTIASEGCSTIELHYRIDPRQRRFTNFKPEPERRYSGMHLQGPNTFLYVQGAERGVPVSCRYVLPEGWAVANGMNVGADPFLRRAKDYDTLIDNPTILGRFERRTFIADDSEFACVFWSPADRYDFDIDGFVEICKKIVTYQGSIFGGFPFRRYEFLFTVSAFGGGGLEHLTSTSIGLGDRAMARNPVNGASITAHEFFHTWNVKRIRPATLGPFEYDKENYTGNLWVAEGWTSYYGDLTLMRTGLMSRPDYLNQMASGIAREGSKPRRKEHSVTWASRNIWHRDGDKDSGGRVDYYTKGEILGFLIDLRIRDLTDGRKSLDDVMSFMNRWFAERDEGYREDDIERACTAVSNHDFGEFFARYVTGQMDPPYAEILAPLGLDFEDIHLEADFPFTTRNQEDGISIRFLRPESRDSGLLRGDLVTAIDGQIATNAEVALAGRKPGEKLVLDVKRDGETRKVEVELLDQPRIRTTLREAENLDERQRRLLEGWFEGRH